jgi:hypothetical protein
MDPRIEHLFRLREEFQLEIDPVVKRQLRDKLFGAISAFLKDSDLRMSVWDFLAATSEVYRNWKRNPH